MDCPFCYKRGTTKSLDTKLLLELPEYLKEITRQVALGGGEPYLHPDLVYKFSKQCAKNGLICNVTTNGKCNYDLPDKVYKYIKMISVSFDFWKISTFKEYYKTINEIKEKGPLVGCNLLVDKSLFSKEFLFTRLIGTLLKNGCNMVFALYPKNFVGPDIAKVRKEYIAASSLYKHFYVDDLTSQLIKFGYTNWKEPCHYGREIISINEQGMVTGCSFDKDDKSALKLEKAEDILKIKDVKFEKRFSCPYLAMPKLSTQT